MKILLVDDDRSTRYLLGRSLTKRFGCEVIEAADGRQALDALSRDRFRLAILDVQMPVMDGLETLRTLRASPDYASLPVVMLTGERDETIIREILELGVLEYMAKPLNMARLSDRLRRILRTIISNRAGAADAPGWFSRILRNTDAPLLIIEGRTPFRQCFADVFGAHRPVIAAESGVAGMREVVTGNPGVAFIGADLGVLSEPRLLRRIRASPALCRLPLVALVDDEEEGDGRLVNYDGILTRTLAPESLMKRMADLIRLGASSGWNAPDFPPGFRATVMLLCEQVFGMALAVDTMLCDLPTPASVERIHVQGTATLPPGGVIRLEVACDLLTARRAAINLFGIDARMVQDSNAEDAARRVFDLIRTRLAGIYPVVGGGAFEPPTSSRVPHWVPRPLNQESVALCVQAPAKEHEFWLQLEPVRT
jgi:two-component system, chemotaxis family, chemotaxis protein CheY